MDNCCRFKGIWGLKFRLLKRDVKNAIIFTGGDIMLSLNEANEIFLSSLREELYNNGYFWRKVSCESVCSKEC